MSYFPSTAEYRFGENTSQNRPYQPIPTSSQNYPITTQNYPYSSTSYYPGIPATTYGESQVYNAYQPLQPNASISFSHQPPSNAHQFLSTNHSYGYSNQLPIHTPPPTTALIQPADTTGTIVSNNQLETSTPVNVQPEINSEVIHGEGLGSKASNSSDRYAAYNNQTQYKYNAFSVVDEPWNRCLDGVKCGNFPGNECLARETYKHQWY